MYEHGGVKLVGFVEKFDAHFVQSLELVVLVGCVYYEVASGEIAVTDVRMLDESVAHATHDVIYEHDLCVGMLLVIVWVVGEHLGNAINHVRPSRILIALVIAVRNP